MLCPRCNTKLLGGKCWYCKYDEKSFIKEDIKTGRITFDLRSCCVPITKIKNQGV